MYTLFFTLLKSSQSWNIADVLPGLLHCWAAPNIITLLTYTLLQCWDFPNFRPLLTYTLSYYIAGLLLILYPCWVMFCVITLLSDSEPENTVDVYSVFLHCWKAPNLETLVMYYLACYIAELFPIFKLYWGIFYFITLLRCSQSWNTANVYTVLLHCWAVPKLETLVTYTLSYYIAEIYQCWTIADLYLVILHCCTVPNLITLLSHILSYYIAELFGTLKHCWCIPCFSHCWKVPNLETLLTYYLACHIAELLPIL